MNELTKPQEKIARAIIEGLRKLGSSRSPLYQQMLRKRNWPVRDQAAAMEYLVEHGLVYRHSSGEPFFITPLVARFGLEDGELEERLLERVAGDYAATLMQTLANLDMLEEEVLESRQEELHAFLVHAIIGYAKAIGGTGPADVGFINKFL